jgi:hypothetical protein
LAAYRAVKKTVRLILAMRRIFFIKFFKLGHYQLVFVKVMFVENRILQAQGVFSAFLSKTGNRVEKTFLKKRKYTVE